MILPDHRCWLHQAGFCCVINGKMGRIGLLSFQQQSALSQLHCVCGIHCLGLRLKRCCAGVNMPCLRLSTNYSHKGASLQIHLFCSSADFFQFLQRNQCKRIISSVTQNNPPLFACQPVCLFSLAAINNWDPRCNEMVMLVRTIPRPASAFRPPALPGDNNFSTPRLVACMSKAQISAPCHRLWSSQNRRWW